MARFVALAILLAIAAGVYGFIQRSNVTAAQMQIANLNTELEKWKTSTKQYQDVSKTASTDLQSCRAQVTEITTQLEAATAAMKKPAGRR